MISEGYFLQNNPQISNKSEKPPPPHPKKKYSQECETQSKNVFIVTHGSCEIFKYTEGL